MDKFQASLEDEIRREETANKNKRHKIEILKREYEEISRQYDLFKDTQQKTTRDMETKVHNEKHTRATLDKERNALASLVADLKQVNAHLSRDISRAKMFNKKDEEKKLKREELKKLELDIRDRNEKIENHDKCLDRERRRLDDRNLTKKQQEITMGIKQDYNKLVIDINISESRISELTGLKEMTYKNLEDILADKLALDRENDTLEQKIAGKGMSDEEAKEKQFDAEREQIKKIQNSLKFAQENAKNLLERLNKEEAKAKDMHEEKIRLQQEFAVLNEDMAEAKAMQARNREELIRMQIKLSQLNASELRLTEEVNDLVEHNTAFIKKNDELELDN